MVAVLACAVLPFVIGRAAAADAPPPAEMSPHAPVEIRMSPDLEHVLRSLMCRCGCSLTVYDCQESMTCDVSSRMRARAEQMLARGMSPDRTIAAFAKDYGPQVLAAPARSGFELTAWALPVIGLAAGALLVVWALRTWRRGPGDGPETPPRVDPRDAEAVERELERGG
jgi:cytochrome c-type biogenesis protein CcmH/NrfF